MNVVIGKCHKKLCDFIFNCSLKPFYFFPGVNHFRWVCVRVFLCILFDKSRFHSLLSMSHERWFWFANACGSIQLSLSRKIVFNRGTLLISSDFKVCKPVFCVKNIFFSKKILLSLNSWMNSSVKVCKIWCKWIRNPFDHSFGDRLSHL